MRAVQLAHRIGRSSQHAVELFAGNGVGGGVVNSQCSVPVRLFSTSSPRLDAKSTKEKSPDKKPVNAKEWTLEKSFWTHPFVLRMLGYFGAER